MNPGINRREALAAALGASALAAAGGIPPETIRRNDDAVEAALRRQVTDTASRWCGSYADDFGLYFVGTASGILERGTASLICPGSRFHKDRTLAGRLRLAAGFLRRSQHPDGTIDLPTTNFDSPPDTAFVVHGAATAAVLAKRAGENELLGWLAPFLRAAGSAMARGGVHTPNHRWVVSSALAQVNEIFPDPSYLLRVGQWLAEGIDIDADGQYTERSTGVYNSIVDRCLVVLAAKLKRPALLDPVRRNLDSMLWLLHPGYELVTEISRRQDQYERVDMGRYWFPLQYLAVHEGNGRYAALARHFASAWSDLGTILEYPELTQPGPPGQAIPENYEKHFPALDIARIRRGPRSATLLLSGNSRFLTYRRGGAVIQAVRFASAFFGKAQFVPARWEKEGRGWRLSQALDAGYYQPLDPSEKVPAGAWHATLARRRRTEVCRLEQSAVISETPDGIRLRIRADGTADVPLAVEISLRPGGRLTGCVPAPKVADAWILAEGHATYRSGDDTVRFGPGLRQHSYTQIRGGEPKLPGLSVYLCGYTPFDHTFELS